MGYNSQRATEEVWEALLSAGALTFLETPVRFASGVSSTLKVNAEVLDRRPKQQAIVLGHVATFPCIEEADVLLYVPDGMRNFTNVLGREMGKRVAQTERNPNSGSRYDFCFATPQDKQLALTAKRPRILEDVVTTAGSIDGIVQLLRRGQQDIHSLALLLRGHVNTEYQLGLTDHYLVERQIPLDQGEFMAGLEPWEMELIRESRQQG